MPVQPERGTVAAVGGTSAHRHQRGSSADSPGRRRGGGGAVGLAAALRSPLRSLHGQTDRENQHRAVEQRLDEERRAQLIEPGDRHRENGHGEDRAPDVDPARTDRGRPEQRRGEGGQQIFLADRTLADLQLRLQDDAGERGERPGGDEAEVT